MPAETLRIATYHAPFSAKGPALLLRDLLRAPDAFADRLSPVLSARPDVLVLTDIDYDGDLAALTALRDVLATGGLDYPHLFAPVPNTGMPTGLDIDGDGRTNGARDAQGYGRFPGDGGLAVLSRVRIRTDEVSDLSDVLWRDVPESRIAPDDPATGVQRLSTAGHWRVPLDTSPRVLNLMMFAATPPVFDGPEDRNGRRNADEVAAWSHVLDGRLGDPVPDPFVIAGLANLDPDRGEGLRDVMRNLLLHTRLQDPQPQGPFGAATADWEEPSPGRLRVSYVLPSADLTVTGSAVEWADNGSPHKLVWVDVSLTP